MKGLSDWIQQKHLEDDVIEQYRGALSTHGDVGIALDNFVLPDIAQRIAHFADREAIYEDLVLLYSKMDKPGGINRSVSLDEWESADDRDRFCLRRQVVGVNPEFRMSRNWLTYLFFQQFLKSSFLEYLLLLTGSNLRLGTLILDAQQGNGLLRKHSDHVSGRKYCGLLYIGNDWGSDCGGELVMERKEGEQFRYEATFNRLLLFRVTRDTMHFVAPFSESAGDKVRKCIVCWFHEKLSG